VCTAARAVREIAHARGDLLDAARANGGGVASCEENPYIVVARRNGTPDLLTP
jgi:hypothetical protein